MYTQCPECQVAFRVTAKILQQASGNVRCGACNKVFNALSYLSEDMPGQAPGIDNDELADTKRRLLETLDLLAGTADVRIEDTGVEWQVLDEEESEGAADESFEELRYDDNTPLPENFGEGDRGEYHAPTRAPRSEDLQPRQREFGIGDSDLSLSEPEDWTDLLDELRDPDILEVEEELAAIHTQLTGKQELAPRSIGARGAGEHAEAVDFELTSEDESAAAEDLDLVLAEAEPEVDLMLDDEASDPDVVLEQAAAEPDVILGQLAAGDEERAAVEPPDAAIYPVEDSNAGEDQELLAGTGADGPGHAEEGVIEPEAADDYLETAACDEADAADQWPEEEADEPGAADDEDYGPEAPLLTLQADGSELAGPEKENPDLFVPIPSEEEVTVNREIDRELLAAASADAEDDSGASLVSMDRPERIFEQHPEDVETIIMEGEFVRTAMDEERGAADSSARESSGEFENLADTYALNRTRAVSRRFERPGAGVSLLAVLLVLTLGIQFVHHSRETLATFSFFDQTVGPVYRVLGIPVTPAWDIRGWQFEATNGSVNEEETVLTIVSRIGNRSDRALPYPLIHVSLTDRYEEIMGSRILEPGEYLPSDADPSRAVLPGANFTAVVTVQEPSKEATGFKLNVCYRVVQGTMRCAIEDFKN